MLLLLAGIVLLIWWLVRRPGAAQPGAPGQGRQDTSSALAILDERYARGEISKEEYEGRRKILLGQ
ncbi:MAG TPA: SHOCT domain-containing protein [Candidatus Aquicultor sp.]|jgi:putative membrane protein